MKGNMTMNISEMKVLVCDDSILVRKKLSDLLKKTGITQIIEAKDGVQAVELYKENKPDIVFMDIVMPVKTGLDALVEIREFDENARVVMASTIGTQSHLVSAIKAGAYQFLQKPLREDEVTKIITKLTEN